MNFEVLTAVLMKVKSSGCAFFVVGFTISDVSSDYRASIFRVGKCNPKRWVHTCNVTAYRNTVS